MKKFLLLGTTCTMLALSQTGCVALLAGGAVGTGAIVASDSRTAGTMINDEEIEMKASRVVSNNREIYEASKLDVVSVNGRVLLTGQCTDSDYISYIEDRVSKIEHVNEVINRIEKIPPVSLSQKTSDSWITTKAKTQLLFGKDINSGRFKVITENGVIYLIGLVTKSEGNRAVNVARGISGVKKVVKIFDYISDESKVAKIIREDSDSVKTFEPSQNQQVLAPVDEAGNATGTENNPIIYEESSIIEQPLSSATSSVNTLNNDNANVITGGVSATNNYGELVSSPNAVIEDKYKLKKLSDEVNSNVNVVENTVNTVTPKATVNNVINTVVNTVEDDSIIIE